jgi:hypothetical protein
VTHTTFSIDGWCQTRGISLSLFYILDRQGKAPRTFYAGRRRLISSEADADWLRQREAEAAEVRAA